MNANKQQNRSLYLFGLYPQSIKSQDVIIDETASYIINNWTCYKGSDGFDYVKETAINPNSFNDKKFKESILSNGENVIPGKTYYFKMEPISWIVLENKDDGCKLLVAEKGLDVSCFDNHIKDDDIAIIRNVEGKNIIPSDYKYSNIRAFLNGLDGSTYDVQDFRNEGFINKAFSVEEQENIKESLVDNSEKSIIPLNIQDEYLGTFKTENSFSNTKDKIFLLSFNEVAALENNLKVKQYTDYALIKGACGFFGDKNYCNWWLRSPEFTDTVGYEKTNAAFVQNSGEMDIGIHADIHFAVIPALIKS